MFTRARRLVSTRPVVLKLGVGLVLPFALGAQTPTIVTLDEAIAQALTENLGLRIERLEPAIAADAVVAAEAGFDVNLFASASLNENDADNEGVTIVNDNNTPDDATDDTTFFSPSSSDNRSYQAGASKRLAVTNATLTASTSVQRSDGQRYNPELGQLVGGNLSETASLSLRLNQPLLRDRGRELAELPVERARASERAAQIAVQQVLADLLESTEVAYWQVAEAASRLSLRQSNLRLAENLLEETRERERLGLATALEVIQAEANLAQREEEIIIAEQALRERQDDLLLQTGAFQEDFVVDDAFTVASLPPIARATPPFEAVWSDALRHDFASRRQAEVIRQRELEVLSASNETRPELDLNLEGRFYARSDEDAAESYKYATRGDGKDWSLQLGFSMPLGRRAALAGQRQASRRLEQAELQLLEVKRNLFRSVRSAWRELAARQKRLRAAELVLRLQEETFAQERSRMEEGLSTLRDVLEVQRDLDNAQLGLLDARSRAILAEVALERLRGTLLERHGLDWETALAQP